MFWCYETDFNIHVPVWWSYKTDLDICTSVMKLKNRPWWRSWRSGSRAASSWSRPGRWSRRTPADATPPRSAWRWPASCPTCSWPCTWWAPLPLGNGNKKCFYHITVDRYTYVYIQMQTQLAYLAKYNIYIDMFTSLIVYVVFQHHSTWATKC